MALLGAHVSVAGGLSRAFARGEALGCESIQIFVKNASRWQARPLEESTITEFAEARERSPIGPVIAHAAYLINLGSPKPEVRSRSIEALVDELSRCRRLDLDGLVFHPGAHLESGEEEGLRSIMEGMNEVLARVPTGRTRLLLETTAGQGTVLGYRFEQLESLIEGVADRDAVGICLDTCHLLAAGYSVDSPSGMTAMLDEVFSRFGADRLACVHVNDSKHPRGSRKDRHCNVGDGFVGAEALRALADDSRLRETPLILETPSGEEEEGHRRDLIALGSTAAPAAFADGGLE